MWYQEGEDNVERRAYFIEELDLLEVGLWQELSIASMLKYA
jgi:hypothetical protein